MLIDFARFCVQSAGNYARSDIGRVQGMQLCLGRGGPHAGGHHGAVKHCRSMARGGDLPPVRWAQLVIAFACTGIQAWYGDRQQLVRGDPPCPPPVHLSTQLHGLQSTARKSVGVACKFCVYSIQPSMLRISRNRSLFPVVLRKWLAV